MSTDSNTCGVSVYNAGVLQTYLKPYSREDVLVYQELPQICEDKKQ